MSIHEYLFRKWQAGEKLTDKEEQALFHLAQIDPIKQADMECDWYNARK